MPASTHIGGLMANLRFHETHRYAYPYQTTGVGTALTVCLRSGDPALAFVTQTGYADEVVYLALGFDFEYNRIPTPTGREVISGMGYNPITRKIWCGNTTNDSDEVFAFDPVTGAEVSSRNLSGVSNFNSPQGFATNGLLFMRSRGAEVEMHTMSGALLGARSYPGRSITGASASPWSWTLADAAAHEIVVIGPFGNELECGEAPGTAGGMGAIAFDTVSELDSHPQVWLEPGIIGDPGTIHHPDTPWAPEPWTGRHRLYVANDTDQTIYAGFLTEN